MTSILLFGYAAILAVPVAWLLRRATWTSRAPALGVIAWHLLSVGVLVAILFGAFAAIPNAGGDHDEHNHLAVAEACLVAVVFLTIVGAILGKALVSYVQAHLRGRHHLALAAGRVLRLAFPWVPAFRWAHDEVARLVELIADDAAARHCDRRDLARALVALAADSRSVVPATAFAAGGHAVAVRVKRLLGSERPLGRRAVAMCLLAFLVLLAVPMLAVSPALAGAGDVLSHCPFV
jgi:hypothetical protein